METKFTKFEFENTAPTYDNGVCKWYIDKHFQNYIENEQAENLPKLKGFGCFVVVGKNVMDYVLIDNKQNVIDAYSYDLSGADQMEARINMIKISKHFDDNEQFNI